MKYTILIKRPAQKALARIVLPSRDRIIEKIRALAAEPRPAGAKKLINHPAWRIRVGEYRVIYEIKDRELLIFVIDIGNRKDIYRRENGL